VLYKFIGRNSIINRLSTMSKITDMPVELLEIIFVLFPVIHCTQVCRLFNRIANRFLYRRVLIRSDQQLYKFSRSIISRPILGEPVQYLSLDVNHSTCLDNRDHPFFTAEAASRGLNRYSQRDLWDVPPDDMLFLLLFYLPTLRALNMEAMPSFSTITGEILHASPLPSGLQSVQYLHFSNVMLSSIVVPFLTLPALDTLSVSSLYDESDEVHILPGSSNVKHFKLVYCGITTPNLPILLRSSRSLRSFEAHYLGTRGFDAPSFGNALRECALTTLEHLELEFFYSQETRAVGPLCEFLHLRHVCGSLSILLGMPSEDTIMALASQLNEILPESLVSLDVLIDRHWNHRGVEVVAELVKIRGERLMLLTSLTVRGDLATAGLDKIESACVAESVEFSSRRY
jgi:hypothetical protein